MRSNPHVPGPDSESPVGADLEHTRPVALEILGEASSS